MFIIQIKYLKKNIILLRFLKLREFKLRRVPRITTQNMALLHNVLYLSQAINK